MKKEPQPPFPSAVTVRDAARIVQKTRAAITHAVRVGALKAIKEEGIHGRVWIDLMDLRAAYPSKIRKGQLRHRVFRLTDAQQDEVLGFPPTVNGVVKRPKPIEGIGESDE